MVSPRVEPLLDFVDVQSFLHGRWLVYDQGKRPTHTWLTRRREHQGLDYHDKKWLPWIVQAGVECTIPTPLHLHDAPKHEPFLCTQQL